MRIHEIRLAHADEMELLDWAGHEPPTVIVLDNNIVILPACDSEMNAPGHMLAIDTERQEIYSI